MRSDEGFQFESNASKPVAVHLDEQVILDIVEVTSDRLKDEVFRAKALLLALVRAT